MAIKVSVTGLFCFCFPIVLASASLAADVDLCGVGKIEGKNLTLALNFTEENAMKNGGECSRVVFLESARVKLVVEQFNLANGAVFEIYDGPSPEKGQLLGLKADTGLPLTYITTSNALFIKFRDSQKKEGPSSFRGKVAPEPYQHMCRCRSVNNGTLECSESDRERSCKVKCQPSYMDLSISKEVKCDLVKGEWDIDIHNMHIACQKVQSPLQIKALLQFDYVNATCKDADSEKIKSAFRVSMEQNNDVKTKGVCFAPGGDENVDCKGKEVQVNCTGDKPARMIITITDRVTKPPTLKEANVKLQELITAYKNLNLDNVLNSKDLVMNNGSDSFTPDKASASIKVTPLCDNLQHYIKVPGNDTSFVCSTCPLHHAYNTSTHMCEECPSGSRASSGAISCTKSDGTIKMTPIKTPCNSACMKGRHVDSNSKMCEWCPQDTYQNSSTRLNPTCMPCPDQKKTSFPGAQSVGECRDPCSSGSFYNTSSGACQSCTIGSYIGVDNHALTKCKTCSVGKTTRATGSKDSSDCYTRCPPGQFYNSDSKQCTPCGKGKYQDKMGEDTCMDCPMNKTTLNPGSKSSAECIMLCGPGQFLMESNGKCDDCPMNTYQDINQHQNKTCKSCGPDKITNATGKSSISQCFEKCSKGQFLNKSSIKCKRCPAGEYQDQLGQEQCKKCPPGHYQDLTGQEQCKKCPAGKYQDLTGQEQCKKCPPGHYQDLTGQEQCKKCPAGKYQDLTGQEQCKNCSTGEYQDLPGQEQCQNCSTGEYQDLSGQEQCKNCSAGEYQDLPGQEQCKKCPSGEYQDQPSQKLCKKCPSGEYQDLPGQEQCKQCGTGEYQYLSGQEQCKKCATGKYQDQTGQGQCKNCSTGEYQDQPGQEQCKKCGTGEYQYLSGQEQCKKCATGKYQDQTGQGQCKNCSTGEYQDQPGQKLCKKCPSGEYQEQTSQEYCKKCPEGKTTENKGTDDSKACITIDVKSKFELSLRFASLSWSEELKEEGSMKYQETKAVIEKAIQFEFRYDQSFESVEVTNLKKGSVIAEFDVSFNDKADYNPVKVLQEAVDKGHVGNLTVSPQSLNILHQPCHQPLGMENGQIKNKQITASTFFKHHEPSEARLNAGGGEGWHAKYIDKTEYLQIDFESEVNITGVATQGVSSEEYFYVTEYKLNMSKDGIVWHEYTENNKSKV